MSLDQSCGRKDGGEMGAAGSLVAQLASEDGLERQAARERLVAMGKLATTLLIGALDSPSGRVRWEATKALSDIADPYAAEALIDTLEDQHPSVRWLAVKGLIALERRALLPLMEALTGRSHSVRIRDGARLVLYALMGQEIAPDMAPVLAALEDYEPELKTPVAAYEAIKALRSPKP